MSTSGELLRHKLGLTNFKYVVLTRALISNFKMYLVFFDSRNPNTPITSAKVLKFNKTSMLYQYPFSRRPTLTPMMRLEDYAGAIETGTYFVIDISGQYGNEALKANLPESQNILSNELYRKGIGIVKNGFFKGESKEDTINQIMNSLETNKESAENLYNFAISKSKQLQKFKENSFYIYCSNINQLLEGLTIPDVRYSAISDRNKSFLQLRRSEGESGSTLVNVEWIEEDSILLTYYITPTYEKKVLNYDETGSKYFDNKYIAEIQFINVSKFLGDKETFKSFTPSESGKLVLELLNNCEARFWVSDPSWIFQGAYEAFDDLDASIYPLWSKRGTGIWNSRHGKEPHISKHMVEILTYIKNNYSDISKKLREN